MNPDPFQIALQASIREHEDGVEAERRNALHAKAIARRRKAKRGGKR